MILQWFMFLEGQTSYITILVKSSIAHSISIILRFYCKIGSWGRQKGRFYNFSYIESWARVVESLIPLITIYVTYFLDVNKCNSTHVLIYENLASKIKLFGVKEFFSSILISEMNAKRNFRINYPVIRYYNEKSCSWCLKTPLSGLLGTPSKNFFCFCLFRFGLKDCFLNLTSWTFRYRATCAQNLFVSRFVSWMRDLTSLGKSDVDTV